MQKMVQNWKFFYERYATRQEWLTWFHGSKDNTTDNRSYADVVRGKGTCVPTLGSPDKFAQFHLNSSFSANKNQKVLDRIDMLERHRHQSPVNHNNSSSPRVIARASMGPFQK